MNPMDIMKGLNGIKDGFVMDAQDFRQGKRSVRHIPHKKLWLIAAIIALALLLVGCTVVYVLRLQDLAFGQDTQEVLGSGVEDRTLLSLQGVKGTPGYQATKEWHEWLKTYDPDDRIYHSQEAFSEDFGDDYYAYNLYTREMKDKLDEICEKYQLNLLGKMYVDPDEAAACKALGIQGILRSDARAQTNFGSVRYYADGSFTVEGKMTMETQVWPYEEIVTFSCCRKDSFSNLYGSVGPEGTYEEWTYTTTQGVDVLLVLEQRNAMNQQIFLMADRGEYVFTFHALEYDREWTRDALEAYAEAFDFTVQPQQVHQEALAQTQQRREEADEEIAQGLDKRMHSYSDLGYDARIKSRMEFITHPSQLGFCLMDLNGDGAEELIVGENGYIIAIYTKRDDGTQYIMSPTIAYPSVVYESNSYVSGIGFGLGGSATYMYLCADNVIANVFVCTDGSVAYHFVKGENGSFVWDKSIVHYTENSEYYRGNAWVLYPESPAYGSVPTTEAEFNEILSSHPRLPITLTPITQYQLADSSPSGIGMPDEVYSSYGAIFQNREAPLDGWNYSLLDLDGDGQDELFLTKGAWKGVLTVKNGRVKILECGQDIRICKGNYILHTCSYLDGNSATSVYKVQNGNTILVDYVRYDNSRENPWLYAPDAQDESLKPITRQQYEDILSKYEAMTPEMHPVSGGGLY